MDLWAEIFEFLLLLSVAFALGILAERVKQSAIIGYLIAGAVLGPLLFQAKVIQGIAELGVALLLFSIGLEFSFKHLRKLGAVALGGGSLQVILTMVVFAAFIALLRPLPEAVALGAVFSLSSTAVVMRILQDRAEIDSVHGRHSVGILLTQDIAVVPLVLLFSILGQAGGAGEILRHIVKNVLALLLLVLVFYGLFQFVVPRLLASSGMRRNRELLHLLTMVSAIGASWLSHALGLSPALGAFLAGMLLAESVFAVQIRSDIGPIKTLFVTLFFTSIGMMLNPRWMAGHIVLVIAALALILLGKTLVTAIVVRLFGSEKSDALATAISLSQIGEFSFVLATVAAGNKLIDSDALGLVSSVTVLSLLVSPFLVNNAKSLSDRIAHRRKTDDGASPAADEKKRAPAEAVLLIGFGPAGREVARALVEKGIRPAVLEMNPSGAADAQNMGFPTVVGDARQGEILTHTRISERRIIVVTVPDPHASRAIVEGVRAAAPKATVIVRARYNILKEELMTAGADSVCDEETEVGRTLAGVTLSSLEEILPA